MDPILNPKGNIMSTTLVLCHTNENGGLPAAALEAVTAAKAAGGEIVVGLIGADTAEAANILAGCGAQQFLSVSGEAFGISRYASDVAAAKAIFDAANPELVVAPGTDRFARTIPGLAKRCGGRIDTHIAGIHAEDGLTVERWFYRQRILATLSRTTRPWFLLTDAGAFEAWQGEAGKADVTAVDVDLPADQLRTTVVGVESPAGNEQTIRPDAEVLLVAGAGWTKKQSDGQPHIAEAADLIKGFIQGAQASLGSSKSLVDLESEGHGTLSFMSHLNQVGQTGSSPRHPKGLATCCHGEEPHVVGWRFIPERRAVNLDTSCGWAQGKADVLYVADAFKVMEKLNELLG
jgi:electron transfer flavoprotein alpha subunit